MTKETATLIAKSSSAEDIKKWSEVVGKFAREIYPHIVARFDENCKHCPLYEKTSGRSCEDCPAYAVRFATKQIAPRLTNAVLAVNRVKYSRNVA